MRGRVSMQEGTGHMDLILVALGANLPSRHGSPRQSLEAAYLRLEELGLRITARSRFWLTEPVPVSDQPWFHNAVCAVETNLPAPELLALLHRVEDEFGRVRSEVNAPRVLDLDLLAYGRQIIASDQGLVVPHPRLAERAFVLFPLQDIAPDWVHPASGEGLAAMIARIPPGQQAQAEDDIF